VRHGNQIWLSELLSVGLVVGVLLSLAAMGTAVLVGAARIRSRSVWISRLEREDLELTHRLDELRSQVRLLEAFRSFVGRRVPLERVHQLVGLVYQNGQQFGYDPLLVLAVIRVESYFDPHARGVYKSGKESGALGLMQLKFETAQLVAGELGIPLNSPSDLLEPQINIPLGVGYLTKQISFFKSFRLGLLAYNLGPGTVLQKLNEKKPLPMKYYESVLKHYFDLKRIARETDEAARHPS
jgi:hypothetical protein